MGSSPSKVEEEISSDGTSASGDEESSECTPQEIDKNRRGPQRSRTVPVLDKTGPRTKGDRFLIIVGDLGYEEGISNKLTSQVEELHILMSQYLGESSVQELISPGSEEVTRILKEWVNDPKTGNIEVCYIGYGKKDIDVSDSVSLREDQSLLISRQTAVELQFLKDFLCHKEGRVVKTDHHIRLYMFACYSSLWSRDKFAFGEDVHNRIWSLDLWDSAPSDRSLTLELPIWCNNPHFVAKFRKEFPQGLRSHYHPNFKLFVLTYGMAKYISGTRFDRAIAFSSVGIPTLELWIKTLEAKPRALPGDPSTQTLEKVKYIFGKFLNEEHRFDYCRTLDDVLEQFCDERKPQMFARTFLNDDRRQFTRALKGTFNMLKFKLNPRQDKREECYCNIF
mmetsp:Transcript_47944/g.55245  ORF Transcript_47944/g.55245 Transcript_47944/m.55245 type:complete len:394 (+) Transcript_47944:225-1406(+)